MYDDRFGGEQLDGSGGMQQGGYGGGGMMQGGGMQGGYGGGGGGMMQGGGMQVCAALGLLHPVSACTTPPLPLLHFADGRGHFAHNFGFLGGLSLAGQHLGDRISEHFCTLKFTV